MVRAPEVGFNPHFVKRIYFDKNNLPENKENRSLNPKNIFGQFDFYFQSVFIFSNICKRYAP